MAILIVVTLGIALGLAGSKVLKEWIKPYPEIRDIGSAADHRALERLANDPLLAWRPPASANVASRFSEKCQRGTEPSIAYAMKVPQSQVSETIATMRSKAKEYSWSVHAAGSGLEMSKMVLGYRAALDVGVRHFDEQASVELFVHARLSDARFCSGA